MPNDTPPPRRARAPGLQCAAWLAALLLAGCTSEATKREAEFEILMGKLPGQYDNLAQAKSDVSGQHAAVALLIRPVNALAVGKIVMFARETAADDPRRVLSQHIWTFQIDSQQRLVQTVYLFKEPQRWVHAVDDPYVIQSVLPADLSPLAGCELIWRKSDAGFLGTTKADTCRGSAGAEGLLIEQSAELRGSELLINEQLSGTGSSLEGSADATSSYRFQRRAGPLQKQ